MKKLLIAIILFLFTTVTPIFAQEESPTPTSTSSNSYELFYPIVAGKVSGDSLYPLKLAREWIVNKLIFDSLRKADYHLILSKKRLVETEELIVNRKDVTNAEKSVKRFVEEYKKALEITQDREKKGQKVDDLYNTLYSDGNKELNFFKDLIAKSEIKESLQPYVSELEGLVPQTKRD